MIFFLAGVLLAGMIVFMNGITGLFTRKPIVLQIYAIIAVLLTIGGILYYASNRV